MSVLETSMRVALLIIVPLLEHPIFSRLTLSSILP